MYPDYPVPPPSLSHPLPATYSLHPQHTTVTMTSTFQTLAFKLAPPSREAGPEQLEPCNDGAGRRYEVVPSVVCSMCCLFGIIYCFFGELSHPCLLMHHQETIFVCITTKWCYFYRWKPIDSMWSHTHSLSLLELFRFRVMVVFFLLFFSVFLCRTHVLISKTFFLPTFKYFTRF